jgi:N-acetylneuraminate synthase
MVMFIAEVSSNHARDIERCYEFVDCAAEIGCDAVKFQLFRIDELYSPEILERSATHRARREWELPVDFLAPLAERCQQRKIEFICTPFSLHAVEELQPFVARYKVASYELLWNDLIRACARTGKPLILSTGMANESEIEAAVASFHAAGGADLTLLHCISGYPTPVEDANLSAIQTLRKFGCPIGWSDHSVRPGVIHRAVHRWGATVIEFHLDLDGRGAEYAAGHCWLPEPIKMVIADIRDGLRADGDGSKTAMPAELSDRDWRADPSDGLRPLKHLRAAWAP